MLIKNETIRHKEHINRLNVNFQLLTFNFRDVINLCDVQIKDLKTSKTSKTWFYICKQIPVASDDNDIFGWIVGE